MNDSEIMKKLTNVNIDVLPRRINFVRAEYTYQPKVTGELQFVKNTDNYSIFYGGVSKTDGDVKPSIYDPKKMGEIKNWAKRFNIGIGYEDRSNRGFAISVLFALKNCPSFRQFSKFHKSSCKRVGCSLCKIYLFFDDLENKKIPQFPLDLNVFLDNWKNGEYADSAEFLNNLLNILQAEEISASRSFSGISQYSTAIGQMFRIETINKLICKNCGRVRNVNDSFWTLIVPNKVESIISEKNKIPIEGYLCDACQNEMLCQETFKTLPFVLTMQVNNWNNDLSFKKKKYDISKILNIKVSDISFRLCAFTAYDGITSEGGRYFTVFLSSSGIWNIMKDGKIQTIESSSLNSYNPQLLFFTRNENNIETESVEIHKIQQDEKSDSSDDELFENETKTIDYNTNTAIENLTKSIEKQIKKNLSKEETKRNVNDNNEKIIVDTTNKQKRKIDKKHVKARTVTNPMEMLLKTKNVHDTLKWDGVQVSSEEQELTKRWQEVAPDEWDQSLDKGHVRKVKTKRAPPVANPFDNVKSSSSDIFGKKDKHNKKDKFKKNFKNNKKR